MNRETVIRSGVLENSKRNQDLKCFVVFIEMNSIRSHPDGLIFATTNNSVSDEYL